MCSLCVLYVTRNKGQFPAQDSLRSCHSGIAVLLCVSLSLSLFMPLYFFLLPFAVSGVKSEGQHTRGALYRAELRSGDVTCKFINLGDWENGNCRLTYARDQDLSLFWYVNMLMKLQNFVTLLPHRPNMTGRGTSHVCCKLPFVVSYSNLFGVVPVHIEILCTCV